MSVLDTLVYMFETTGAKEASGEVKNLNTQIGEAEKQAREYGAQIDALKQKLKDLSVIKSTASKETKEQITSEMIETRKKINLAMANQSIQRNLVKDLKEQVKTQKDSDRSSKDLGSSVASLATKFTAAIAPLIAFKKALNMTLEMSQTGNDMRLLAQSAGIPVERIQTLGQALKTYGGNAASASAVMLRLNTSLQQMRMGQGGALQEAALLYGVKFSGSGTDGMATAEEMLVNIARRMETMTTQQQLDFGHMLGLDAPTIMIMQRGVSGLTQDLEEAAKHKVFNDADFKRIQAFNQRLIDMRANFQQLKLTIATAFMPVIEALGGAFAWLSETISNHKIIATGAIYAISAALVALGVAGVAALVPLIGAVWSLAAGVLAATWPFLAIAAAIGAIAYGVSSIFKQNGLIGIKEGAASSMRATRTPLSAMSGGTISNMYSRNNASNNVSIQGGITVNTAATDSEGIAKDIGSKVTKVFQSVLPGLTSGALA